MNTLRILVTIASVCCGNVVPSIPGDNNQYVEGESRYIWMPDVNGIPHHVDLQEPVQTEMFNSKNGAQNQYWLFTRYNPTSPQMIVHGNASTITNSNYLGSKPLKVIVHGWNNNGNSDMNPLITSAFLAVQECNVIVVDWSGVANFNYVTATNGVRNVGEFLGSFLNWLINTSRGSWNNVHLVGFSLGAHVVGNAGRTASARPMRVTGLDPAGPLWSGNSYALNTDSGQYVEAIHTDGGILGLFGPVAHADFYPNGGRNPQPGCSISTCSHHRVIELFAATVRFDHLVGKQCANTWEAVMNNCSGRDFNMGNSVLSKSGSGIYGLVTGSDWPY